LRENREFLCSELIKVSADETVQVGNLELIHAEGCTVSTPDVLAIGTEIRMQCLECPQGKRVCRECRFDGQVESSQRMGALGSVSEIGFTKRSWSPEEWRPDHLTELGTAKE